MVGMADVRGTGAHMTVGEPARGAVRETANITVLSGPVAMREVTDVETMRVLADPLRIGILRRLMTDATVAPPVMSAKELAAALNEPQTKLYRHLKQLEDAGLIQVAETRMVSGILEQRYRTGQLSLGLSRELVGDPANRSEVADSIAAMLDDFRVEFLDHLRSGRIALRKGPEKDPIGPVVQAGGSTRVSLENAAAIRAKLAAVLDEFEAMPEDPDGVSVQMFAAWYAVKRETD
jgi:DNA-binding transcriptional ArsR family regulator